MKEQNYKYSKLSLDVSQNTDEIDNLLDEEQKTKDIFTNESVSEMLIFIEKKIGKKRKCIHFIIIFLILILIFAIILIILYILYFKNNKPNFRIIKIPWGKLDLNDREYQYYIYDNNLEVLLIHDSGFDMDGGAIVIDSGYLDDPYDEGIAFLAISLLSHITFNDTSNIPILDDYFGNYAFEVNKDFVNFRFDILNAGFKKFLSFFGTILNRQN